MIVLISLHADRDESFKVNVEPCRSASPLSSLLILMNVQELDLGILEIGTLKERDVLFLFGTKMFFFLLIFLVEKLDLISYCSLVIFWLIFTRTY